MAVAPTSAGAITGGFTMDEVGSGHNVHGDDHIGGKDGLIVGGNAGAEGRLASKKVEISRVEALLSALVSEKENVFSSN